jgi:hypothetical protein
LLLASFAFHDGRRLSGRFSFSYSGSAVSAVYIGSPHRLGVLSSAAREHAQASVKPGQLGSVVAIGLFRDGVYPVSSVDGERGGESDVTVNSMKRRYILGILVALLLGALVYVYGGSQVPPGQPPLRRITAQNVGEIKSEFNAARDDVRVLLLLSPT